MGAFLLWSAPGAPAASVLSFDVVVNENPQFPTQITEHVVEQGADVSDNVRVGLKAVTLEVFVTNEPLDPTPLQGTSRETGLVTNLGPVQLPDANQPPQNPATNFVTVKTWFTLPIGVPLLGSLLAQEIDSPRSITAGLPPTLGQSVNPRTLQWLTPFDAVQITHDLLDQLRTTVQLVSVYGTKGTYDNMVIERFDMKREADDGSGASFTIELKEIRQVSSKIVAAPVPTKPRGNTATNKGSQSKTPNGSAGQPLNSGLKSLENLLFPGMSTPPIYGAES